MLIIRQLALATFVALLFGCGPKSTPVTPQPLGAEEQARVSDALKGRWKAMMVKVGEGEKKNDGSDVHFTFNADGTYRHQIGTPVGEVDKTYTYKLDGKNVVTNSPHGTYRIDEITDANLALFHYDASTTWYLSKH